MPATAREISHPRVSPMSVSVIAAVTRPPVLSGTAVGASKRKRPVASRAYVSWFNFKGRDQQRKVGSLAEANPQQTQANQQNPG